MDNSVYFGIKGSEKFLFQKDGNTLLNVVKILSIVQQRVVQQKIIKGPQDQQVIQSENALPMLMFFKTNKFKFFDSDYEVLEDNHPYTVFYKSFIESTIRQKKETEERKATEALEQAEVNKKIHLN